MGTRVKGEAEKSHRNKQNFLMYIIIAITIIGIVITYWSTLQSTNEITDELADLKEESRQTNVLIEGMTESTIASVNKLKESVDREFEVEHFQPIVFIKGGNILLKQKLYWEETFIETDRITVSAVTNDHLELIVKSGHLRYWNNCFFESKPVVVDVIHTGTILKSNEELKVLEFFVEIDYQPREKFIVNNLHEIPDSYFIHTVGHIFYEVDYTNLQTEEKFQTNSRDVFSDNTESSLIAYIPAELYNDYVNCGLPDRGLVFES